MAKAKAKAKTHKTGKRGPVSKKILLVVGMTFIGLGLITFFLDSKQQSTKTQVKETQQSNMANVGPGNGCELLDRNHVCKILIKNPAPEPLEWSTLLNDLDGASVAGDGYGTIQAHGSTLIELLVPEEFCKNDPKGTGTLTILEEAKSSNHGITEFFCSPKSADASSEL